MKKIALGVTLLTLSLGAIAMQDYLKRKQEVELLRGQTPYSKRPELKRALVEIPGAMAAGGYAGFVAPAVKEGWDEGKDFFDSGAQAAMLATPATLPYYAIRNDGKLRTAAKTAAAGAAIGGAVWTPAVLAFHAGLRKWQVRKINQVLKKYNPKANFYAMPLELAMAVVAADKKDNITLRELANSPSTKKYINDNFNVLTHLYFKTAPTVFLRQQLLNILKPTKK